MHFHWKALCLRMHAELSCEARSRCVPRIVKPALHRLITRLASCSVSSHGPSLGRSAPTAGLTTRPLGEFNQSLGQRWDAAGGGVDKHRHR